MKIAFTADLHLTSRKAHPERYRSLENILQQMHDDKIDTVIVGGDLFNESCQNYSDFEAICRDPKNWGIRFFVLPGNHDPHIEEKVIAAENVRVITQPLVESFGSSRLTFLFVPYTNDMTMGEAVAAYRSKLPRDEWVLIGHGDWVEGMKESNPLEPGVYMPLTRTDVEMFRPNRVLLGHIHKPTDRGIVYYPGSPCSLDVTETGRRRFLVMDTETKTLTPRIVQTDTLYMNESIVVLPVEDEDEQVRSLIKSMIAKWGITENEKSKIRLRLNVSGVVTDKRRLKKTLDIALRGIPLYEDQEVDITGVSVTEDSERTEIARRVADHITELNWPSTGGEPDKDQILLEALHAIYGDK